MEEIVHRGDKVIAANRQVDRMADHASENVSLLELDIMSGQARRNMIMFSGLRARSHITQPDKLV